MSSLLIRMFIAFSSDTESLINSAGSGARGVTTFFFSTSCLISGACSNSVIAFVNESIIFEKSDKES
ncbi:MAG: hypothetical protein IJW20_04365 [Clostridia bacterium]|nr:hypothetical protein [Clostridia bacterium]